MLETPTDSTNKEMQDSFNLEVANSLEKLRQDLDEYKSNISRMYELEGTNGETDDLNWRETMYRLWTKVKDF